MNIETEHRKRNWQGVSKEWISAQIADQDSKLQELRCAIGWMQTRVDFFEKLRRDLILVLDDATQYCPICGGKLIEGYSHKCPQVAVK